MKLSHSGKQLYIKCPYAYHLQYNLKLFRKVVGSALPFGVAMDEGLNHLLLTQNVKESKEIFTFNLLNPKIHNKQVDIFKTENIKYSKLDKDGGFLNKELLETYKDEKELAINVLLEKGKMMIDQYAEDVLPQIRKVYAVQEKIELPNGVGDSITGLVDFIAEFKDGAVVLCDNKTTSRAYKTDVIQTESEQLATYQEAVGEKYGVNEVAYVTINKTIRKLKKPNVNIQIIRGVIPDELKEKTFDEFNNVLYNIKMGNFKSNHPDCFQYGEQCTCVKYLETNGNDMSDLVYVEREYK